MGMIKKETSVPPVPEVPTTKTFITQINEQASRLVEKAGDDKLLTQPKTRDRSIELQALLKSTIESHFLAQLTMGQNSEEATKTLKTVYEKVVKLYDETK